MKDLSHYKVLAEMFRYPSADTGTYSAEWNRIIQLYDPEMVFRIEQFTAHINEKPLSFQQEYYISTFDVQALCFLDVGYVLFGEDYKRGIFLVNIKKEQMKVCNDCGRELPDHLPNILTLLPKMQDEELAEELVCSVLIPAIHEMILKFGKADNLYKGLLEILVTIMEKDFPDSHYERFDFGHQKSTAYVESSHIEKDMSDEFKT